MLAIRSKLVAAPKRVHAGLKPGGVESSLLKVQRSRPKYNTLWTEQKRQQTKQSSKRNTSRLPDTTRFTASHICVRCLGTIFLKL